MESLWNNADETSPLVVYKGSEDVDVNNKHDGPNYVYDNYESDPILVTLENGELAIALYSETFERAKGQKDRNFISHGWFVDSNRIDKDGIPFEFKKVLAWMELPEQYSA